MKLELDRYSYQQISDWYSALKTINNNLNAGKMRVDRVLQVLLREMIDRKDRVDGVMYSKWKNEMRKM